MKVHPLPDQGPATSPAPKLAESAWIFIDPATLEGQPAPEREFIVQDWLAPGHVTINYGDGGVGKTLLTQQLMTSCATAKPWCGLAVTPCRAIGLFCEDDDAELHRRQSAINRAFDIEFRDLGDMRWATGVGQDNTLVTFAKDGTAAPTAAFDRLLNVAMATRAGLVVVDTAADTFGGDENIRRHVRQFVGFVLGKLARDLNAAVLLNAHPSRSGMGAAGDLDGGSTAWSNTARARWSLTRPKGGDDAAPDNNERILTRRKANYASAGDTIKLRWRNGILVPQGAPAGFAAAAQSVQAEGVFLELLERFNANGVRLSQSRHGGNWAPKQMASAPDAAGFTARELDRAMGRLLAANRIEVRNFGRPTRPERGLAIVETGADCAQIVPA